VRVRGSLVPPGNRNDPVRYVVQNSNISIKSRWRDGYILARENTSVFSRVVVFSLAFVLRAACLATLRTSVERFTLLRSFANPSALHFAFFSRYSASLI